MVKNLPANAGDARDVRSDPWVWRIPWSRKWQPTPVFLPGKFHRQRSLGRLQSMGSQRVGHNWAHTHTHTHTKQRPWRKSLDRKGLWLFRYCVSTSVRNWLCHLWELYQDPWVADGSTRAKVPSKTKVKSVLFSIVNNRPFRFTWRQEINLLSNCLTTICLNHL